MKELFSPNQQGLFGDASHRDTRKALFSDDWIYRYRLEIVWDVADKRRLVWFMLNPSTADHLRNDPTVAKCCRLSARWDYPGIIVMNLFAFRATKPGDMKATTDPIGPEYTDDNLIEWSGGMSLLKDYRLICAWGNDGNYRDRGQHVLNLFERHGILPFYLKLNNDGSPAHPLYLPEAIKPQPIRSWKRP